MRTPNFSLLLFISLCPLIHTFCPTNQSATPVKFGLILNLSSLVGKIGNLSVLMALEDFYSEGNHTKLLLPQIRDSREDTLAAASAGLDLLKKEEVEAIVGPQNSGEMAFIANLGDEAHVPIISFTAISPAASSMRTPYFIRAAQDDSSQVDAIVDIVKSRNWWSVITVCEDDDYGRGILPYLADAFQGAGVMITYMSLIHPSASDLYIKRELCKIMTMQTRIFVVHMSPALGARFFMLVHSLGMMSTGYAWIITNGVGNLLGDLDPYVIGSMQGVIGLQTHVPESNKLNDFRLKWMKKLESEHPEIQNPNLNVYALRAYDAMWALAVAAEGSSAGSSIFQYPNGSRSSSSNTSLGVSPTGPNLLRAILGTSFKGLSGDFQLVRGGLPQPATFRVVNVLENDPQATVGSWTPTLGLRNPANAQPSLGSVTWPGGGLESPKGWAIPVKLKVLVPVKSGFGEFVQSPPCNPQNVTGYSIDIFKAVLQTLPYDLPFQFEYYGTTEEAYDSYIDQIYYNNYDALVGDVSIVENRSRFVDFTVPYSDSWVSMIVPVEAMERNKPLTFLEPLTPQLWCVSAAFFFITGVVIWLLEHRINPCFRGPPSQQMGLIFYYALSTMVFAHNERLASNLSRVVVVVWVFVVLILTSSYTASLTSILTAERIQPTSTDLETMIKEGKRIGYQSGSFVKGFLKSKGLKDDQIVALNSVQQYLEALKNETVAAVVDEIPYLKVFLKIYCGGFMMVSPMYRTCGLGFAFPKRSPLVSDVSTAILSINKNEVDKKWFGSQTCIDAQDELPSKSLTLYSFSGLFMLTGSISFGSVILFSFLFALSYLRSNAPGGQGFRQRVSSIATHFDNKDLSFYMFGRESTRDKSDHFHDASLEGRDFENEN